MGSDKVFIDSDAEADPVGNRDRPIRIQFQVLPPQTPRVSALGHVELDEQRSLERANEMQAISRQQVSEPRMRHQVDSGLLGQPRDLQSNRQPAASGQIGLHDIDTAAANEPLEVPDRAKLLSSRQRRGPGRRAAA